jgi:hypothetical protein
MDGKRISDGALVLGVMAALLLIAIEVVRHPASIEGYGRRLLITDIAILLLYGMAGIWAWRQQYSKVSLVVSSGLWIALAAAAVLSTNHIIEVFVPNRPFAVVIAPVLLMFALFGTAGSIAWERTRSFLLAVAGGLWCAMSAMVVLLCFVLLFNLAFQHRAALWLHDAFVASGTSDEGAFLTKNVLEAASEGLVRLPIIAAFLSFTAALLSIWVFRRTRTTAILVAFLVPILCATGVATLWYANTLERAARPPFVMFGVLIVAIALCSAHPAWSALHRAEQ